MQIKVGDLVYRKQHRAFNTPHNYEIWLVLGKGQRAVGQGGVWIQLQNIHNLNKVTCKEHMLMKIETDKKCPLQ